MSERVQLRKRVQPRKRAQPRNRLLLCAWLAALIACGLGSRRLGNAPAWVTLYVGDVAWGALFFTLFCVLLPRLSTVGAALAAVLVTELIESSELYHSPWLDSFRATRTGGLLLGHEFSWSDVVCVALGASLAALVDWTLSPRRPS